MTLLVTEVLNYLEAGGIIGGATGWARAAEYQPPDPDQVVTVFATAGYEPEIVSEGSTNEQALDQPGFQVRVRGAFRGGAAMHAKLFTIFTMLHGSGNVGNCILIRAIQSGPLSMGLDDKGRPEATWNFVATRVRSA